MFLEQIEVDRGEPSGALSWASFPADILPIDHPLEARATEWTASHHRGGGGAGCRLVSLFSVVTWSHLGKENQEPEVPLPIEVERTHSTDIDHLSHHEECVTTLHFSHGFHVDDTALERDIL